MDDKFPDDQLNEKWTKKKNGKKNYKEMVTIIKKVRFRYLQEMY